MKRITFIIAFFLLAFLTVTATSEAASYSYPIKDLGNCRNQQECRLYCEIPAHKATCWSYSVYGSQVLADETPEQKLTPLGITFPIAALGSCSDIKACKAYCTLSENVSACQSFAQSSGLANQQRIVDRAREELGCTTAEECRTYCALETSREACRAFAKRYHLKGALKDQVMELAQQQLGCTNREECKELCRQAIHKDRCEALAKQFNVGQERREELVEKAKETLGCADFESCKTFCQSPDNKEKCRNFGAAVNPQIREKIQEIKGNCETVEECRKACEENPNLCPGFPKQFKATDRPTGASGSGENKQQLMKEQLLKQQQLQKQQLQQKQLQTREQNAGVKPFVPPLKSETKPLAPTPVEDEVLEQNPPEDEVEL